MCVEAVLSSRSNVSISWAFAVDSRTCYSRGYLLVLQCPGGASRTLHVSRSELASPFMFPS